jgi:penicillin-binding protein 1A
MVRGKTIGGKTGTSSNYRDAWFIGATDKMTVGIWVGNDDFTPMADITGGTVPAEIFKQIISE